MTGHSQHRFEEAKCRDKRTPRYLTLSPLVRRG